MSDADRIAAMENKLAAKLDSRRRKTKTWKLATSLLGRQAEGADHGSLLQRERP